MTLMDRRSSEALTMRASASVPGESLKRPFSRLGCGSRAGLKWWSRARLAASWNSFDSKPALVLWFQELMKYLKPRKAKPKP
jgi:hypothetical protein